MVLGLAVSLAGCGPQTILCTISCPVYQPPETPHPDWPRQCGGQSDPGCYSGTLRIDGKAAMRDEWLA
jgi:hypothetical protein